MFFLCTISPVNLKGSFLGILIFFSIGTPNNKVSFINYLFLGIDGSKFKISSVPESVNFLSFLINFSVFIFIFCKTFSIGVSLGGSNALDSIEGITCTTVGCLE